jgi:peptidoglycan LD-endopeptidase CwlK
MKIVKLNEFKLGSLSLSRLDKVDEDCINLVKRALELSPVDFGIAWMGGYRTPDEQAELYQSKTSTKDGYVRLSKHQFGKAIDFLPYVDSKVDLREHNYFLIITAFFIAAKELGLNIRSGANWDSDNEFVTDQRFKDLPHIEVL